MKTTIELPDDLLLAAKKRAVETRTTLRAVFERSLRRELAGAQRVGQAAEAPTHPLGQLAGRLAARA